MDTANFNGFDETEQATNTLSKKEQRILLALLEKPRTRLELDAIGKTTNSPEYIRRLRSRGLNIITSRFEVLTEDGVSYPGRYTPHPESHPLARDLLAGRVQQ